MTAIKAKFDGRQILLPRELAGQQPGEVIVIFSDLPEGIEQDWLTAQEQTLSQVWDNADDAEYDQL